jgi:hypothetical protein
MPAPSSWIDFTCTIRNPRSRRPAASSCWSAGTLRPIDDPSVDFTADSDHLDPGDFIDAASGDFTLTGMLKGSLEKPVGRLTLEGRQVNLAGQAIETVSLDTRIEDQAPVAGPVHRGGCPRRTDRGGRIGGIG